MRLKGWGRGLSLALVVCSFHLAGFAQESTADGGASTSNAGTAVPDLIHYSGVLKDADAKPLTGVTGVTFLLYKEEQGGAPVWIETQNVVSGKRGEYTVTLGSVKLDGSLALSFANGEPRWLGVQVAGQPEQPRVLLVAVPYAMKAADAETLGGLPASAFVLATPPSGAATAATSSLAASPSSASPSSAPPPAPSNVTTTGGTVSTIPMFTTATNIQNSILTQTGSTAINVGGRLNLPALGTATAATGFNSRALDFVASVFNSSTSTAAPQTFQWQAEPLKNDQTTASGTLNLLYATGTAVPAETGLNINSSGIINFAPGQTLPTVTGNENVTGNLSATGSVSGASANFSGAVSTGNQTVNGNITATGSITAGATSLGSATVKGNGLNLALGDPGCSFGFAGLGPSPMSGCTNYALIVDVNNNLYLNRPTGGQIVFREGNNTEMTLASGGNLSIAGGFFSNTTGTAVHGIGSTGGEFETGTGTILLGRGFGHDQLNVDASGNISHSGFLHTGGNLRVEGGISAGGAGLVQIDAPGVVGGRFTVLPNGNVGIGTASPIAPLHVNGNVVVGGSLDFGFQYVIGPTATVSSGTTATIVAICPAGTTIMSGGFDIGGAGVNGARVLTSVPGLVAEDRWVVRLHNDGGADITANAEAVCARVTSLN